MASRVAGARGTRPRSRRGRAPRGRPAPSRRRADGSRSSPRCAAGASSAPPPSRGATSSRPTVVSASIPSSASMPLPASGAGSARNSRVARTASRRAPAAGEVGPQPVDQVARREVDLLFHAPPPSIPRSPPGRSRRAAGRAPRRGSRPRAGARGGRRRWRPRGARRRARSASSHSSGSMSPRPIHISATSSACWSGSRSSISVSSSARVRFSGLSCSVGRELVVARVRAVVGRDDALLRHQRAQLQDQRAQELGVDASGGRHSSLHAPVAASCHVTPRRQQVSVAAGRNSGGSSADL